MSRIETKFPLRRGRSRVASRSRKATVSLIALAIALSSQTAFATAGSITGHVTDGASTPILGICVEAFTLSGASAGEAASDTTGFYAIGGLAEGQYKIKFTDCGQHRYVTEWHQDKSTRQEANLVSVTQGVETTGIDAVLVRAGRIEGRLTDAAGLPASGECATAWSERSPAPSIYAFIVFSDETGAYRIEGLSPDTYTVSFGGCLYQDAYSLRWYDGQSDRSSADPIPLAEGAVVTGINGVTPKLDHLVLSPSSSSIRAGGSQTYRAEGFDRYGNALGDYAAPTMPWGGASFTISPEGACIGGTCSATRTGTHAVHARYGAVEASASLQVTPSDPSRLDLSVSRSRLLPGSTVRLTARLADRFGNGIGVQPLRATLLNPLGFVVERSTQRTNTAGKATWFFSGVQTLVPGTYTVQVEHIGSDLASEARFVVGP